MDSFGDFWSLLMLMFLANLGFTKTENLVNVNKGIQVERGRVAYVTENELQFNIPKDRDSCKVEVVQNEPITQRVGKLIPQVFDCHFLPDEVKYIHNGSPLLEEDIVMLRLYRFSKSDTTMETFTLKVQIIEPQNRIVTVVVSHLEVPEFYGISNPLDGDVLTVQYVGGRPNVICTVRIMSKETFVPAHGQLVTEDPTYQKRGDVPDFHSTAKTNKVRRSKLHCPGNKACLPGYKEVNFLKASCEDFLRMGLKYQHLTPPSPDIDYIPLQVELRDSKSRVLLQTQNIWIPVKINQAVPNMQPQAAFMSMFILEADQFILTPLTTAVIDARDDETPKDNLVFNITNPPVEGYITHLDDHTKPITSFIWQDLHEMKIAYQPSNGSHAERKNFEVEFQVSDSAFKNSPTIMVHFSIRSTETNAPRVSWNMGLDILEGQSHPITWEKFQIVDNDNIDAVRLVTVEGLQHGRLTVRGGKGFMFTVKDIKEGVVHYHHDDSDTTKDFIVFRIFDGKHSIRHKFPINILPKDDSPPFLINNIDFELAEGGTILIQEHMLLASDFDSSDDYILYNITIAPAAGQILKKLNLDGPGVPVSSFLQRDLYHGLIYYHHLGGEIFKDFFEFILSDSHEPPNLSDKHSVTIHIIPVKDQLPQEVSGVLRHLVVKETDIVYFTKHHLNFVDPESPENDLMYIVTKPCFSPGLSRAYDAGKVIFTDKLPSMKKDPTAPLLRSFSQHAVNHLKVAYMPPDEDIGPDPLFVQFEFSVNDQQGGMVSGLVFNITVMPVDNQAPKMFTNAIQAEEGATSYITDKNLVIEDTDTRLHDVRVQLRKKPHHGDVLLHGHVLLEGDYFTTEDVKSFKVSYRHDDSESLEDLIGFRVTDGNNTSDGVLNVKVIPVNDEPPELHSDLKSGLQCPEGGHVIITAEYLYAKDEDSDDNKLTYMIARVPLYGVVKKEKVAVDKFSQLDVIQGLVSYTHTGGEIGCTPHVDTVTLIVSDGEAGTIESCCFDGPHPPPIPLHGNLPVYDLNITVLPVNNQAPTVKAGEVFMVDEGSTACLTADYLNALDEDTLPEEIKFILETSPAYGYLENTLPSPGHEKSNSGIQIADFNLHHLLAGYINYVQSNHTGVEPRTDQFMISVTDGVHKSVVMPFFIVINPANDESPELQLNNITIMEGDICELGPATLNALDIDSPADTLYFSIVKPPVHGLILNGIYGSNIERYKQMSSTMLHRDLSVQSFIMDELKQGMTLMYLHDDTESLKDSFTIQLTDGKYTVQGTVYVHVIPINDERPQLYRNTGLEVNVAESKVISSVALEAEDKDTPRNKLYYILSNEPKFGQLSLKGHLEWLILHSGMNFTQEDVDMNQIWYRHIPNQDLKRHDGFHFFVTDGENNSPSEIFYISIKMSEKGDIVLLTKPVTLTEGDRVTLMTDVLMATDGSGKPEELLYAVSVPPVHGQIEYINYPGVPISSFSQLDVVAQKVCYVHDNSHEANKDTFSFVISNGLSDKNGSLEFAIEHRDRIPPTLNNNKGLQLLEGGMHVISSDDLELADPDSPLENLTFRITQHPQHGTLYLKEGILNHNNFTQKNVNNMDVYYKHNGGSAELDRFYFTATDGNNPGFLVSGLLREDPIAFIIQEVTLQGCLLRRF
ncbi:FRAS1-related extracellular matrix protein 1-like isoform X2 [Protopterus annectens]|uniref:FRAS1-related extracellular matrix protein 1-like isoform X2 n=1 Tax=Protopterus annectens TaxID=7888 RepID=UPI001CFB9445|nr:FRAS1-related extracellular matrix protein 1-like isoform X2 [Protopterus annectens]